MIIPDKTIYIDNDNVCWVHIDIYNKLKEQNDTLLAELAVFHAALKESVANFIEISKQCAM